MQLRTIGLSVVISFNLDWLYRNFNRYKGCNELSNMPTLKMYNSQTRPPILKLYKTKHELKMYNFIFVYVYIQLYTFSSHLA